MLLYASGIIFFTFFYTSITFNPSETAENLRKYGGFVPGIRPGDSTALYIQNISIYRAVLSPGLIPGMKPPYFLRFSAVSLGLKVIDV